MIGLKISGEEGWKVSKHVTQKHSVKHRLYLVVGQAHDIVAEEASLENVHGAKALPILLNPRSAS